MQVHQILTFNHDLAPRHRELSTAAVRAEIDVSVEMLQRTIEHFTAQGKRVVVFGHSYGAILTTRYLWRNGPGAADAYVIMAGRLDMPEVLVNAVANGEFYYFPDAVNPEKHPTRQPTTDREFMELRVMGETMRERYTERLANTDLAKVIYVYGTDDESTGTLTANEDAFLRSRGATVIDIDGGHHSAMFEAAHAPGIVTALNAVLQLQR